MRLSIELLVDALEQRFELQDRRIQQCPPLGRPQLYLDGQTAEPGRLYISDQPARELCRSGVCTLYVGGARPAQHGGCALCVDAQIAPLFNAVQEIFDICEDWNRRLEQVLLRRGSLQELLREARTLLINPLIVMGVDFSLVAQDGEDELEEDQRLFDERYNALLLHDALNQDLLYRQLLDRRVPYLYPGHILGWNSLNVNILQDGAVSHRLVLAEHKRKLRPGDAWLMQTLADYVLYMLEPEQPEHQMDSRLRNLFLRVLSDRTADRLDVSRQLSQLGWSSEDEYFCLVLRMPRADSGGATENQIRDNLKRQYPASCSVNYNDSIVTFFNLSKLGRDFAALSDELKYFIRECLLQAGYSRVMRGHDNLRRLYLQADAAIGIGKRVNPDFWIHHFNSISLNFLLEEAMHRLPDTMLCHEGLLALRDHDAAQGTEYMHTLRVYLDSNLNAVQSARQLFIHRSTLLYRLEKIREILDSPLNDPEELLYLSLSFRLFENRPV